MKKNREEKISVFEKAKYKVKNTLYSASVAVHSRLPERKKKSRLGGRNFKDAVFVYVMLLWPVLQFCVFYIAVNVNSIIMTFQSYDGSEFVFAGWRNFNLVWTNFINTPVFTRTTVNSLLSFVIIQLLSPLVLFFTFFIYKKFPGAKFFKIVLFLPTIISSVITVTVYMKFCEVAIPKMFEGIFGIKMNGLLTNQNTKFGAVMFFYMWLSFGSLMLMYLGAMNGISESVVESVKLEGASSIQEFVHITFPMIYPTFSTLFFTSIAGIFTNQINLYAFWGAGADSSVWTYGYYLYKEVVVASNAQLPYLATLGIIMTLIAAPLTFFFRWAFGKIGPSVD